VINSDLGLSCTF